MSGLIQVVGGAIVDSLMEPTRMLVARRTAPEQLAGFWEFPGGKVDAGEECEAALHRELREELGVEVRLGPELPAGTAAGWRLNERASMRVWLAEITNGDPQPLEDHDQLKWISTTKRDEALSLPWIPADFPIIRALLESLGTPVGSTATR
ncbi:(deoxy)nucleoside triphosphate pyrophosphohydrolase [Pseudarthrobacter sp. NBSH8]|uniref:(deoxy)nucleoside triphosphate pyrophosphohydrolase n=1 Tax=Pseudarthrobacter sp. NBSH8 TaxID=2596911 RepID=UPI001624577E|nr:(deoxy)nucleoside triphosphate pyrophosphohydrolase [Pseudarthrobacter sp. NBSH8]QNE14178.1 (deoxy)nucleoside triphosphate pyrophosphohydrolase [Pseudarthrobacter sp. NBSH8]